MRPKLDFECGDRSLEVRRVTVRDRISTCFVVDVIARSANEQLDLNAFVGKGAGFGAEGELGVVGWSGIVSYMELVKPADETVGMSSYGLRIVPAMWLLTQRRGHRIFQHQSTPDIVRALLGEYQIEPRLALTAEYPRHEYRVQYGESDFQFVTRLLEDAGISYYFERKLEGSPLGARTVKSVLVLADGPQRASASLSVKFYDEPNEGQLAKPYVTSVELWHGVRPGKQTVRDYDFRRPKLELHEPSKLELPADEKPEEAYEQYAFVPGSSLVEVDGADDVLETADDRSIARHHQPELEARALRDAESARHGKRTVAFRSNHPDLFPSAVFTIDGHPRATLSDAELLVTEVNVLFSELEWEIIGRAVPCAAPFRPQRPSRLGVTSRPRIDGVQTAIVVGPAGREIHVDELGRVRVRFHWDRVGGFDDGSTCWLRVSQAWAGAGFGVMQVPRIGQEVIVDFVDGDPDQPMVVGRLFNATTQVPRKLPDHQTQSIWRSATSPQTDGRFNEISFEDKAGRELYFMQAERDLLRLVKRNDTERTGQDRTIAVGEGRVAAVAQADTLHVGKQHLIQMADVRDLHIADMGDPDVKPLPTFIEMSDQKIVLTTGDATIALEGPDITIDAAGGLRFTTDGKLILKGSMVYLNVAPGQVAVRAGGQIEDAVAKPDRMIGSVAELFWQPFESSLARQDQTVDLAGDMPQLVKGDEGATGKYLDGELFVDGASVTDVVQGAIADCYLAAAMASVAHARPDIIEGMLSKTDDGKVRVAFNKGAEVCTVDTEVPVRGDSPLYAKAKDPKEMWPALLEKAYAEQYGMGKGYEGIGHGGGAGTALNHITGGTYRHTPLSASDAGNPSKRKTLLDTLKNAGKRPTVATTPKPPEGERNVPSGRVAGWHCYSVLGTRTDEQGRDMVKLRNPWGGTGGTRGEFEMPVEHFVEDYLHVQQISPA